MTTENTQPPADQPAPEASQGGPDLSHLLNEVDQQLEASDQAQVQADQKIEVQQIGEARVQLRAALGMAKMAARPKLKWWADFEECWSDAQLDAIADAGAQIMHMHGLSMGDLMNRWGPYIALIVAVGGPGLATYAAIQDRREQLAKPRAPAMAPPPAPPSSAQEGIRL
jgi:hypothetical protein